MKIENNIKNKILDEISQLNNPRNANCYSQYSYLKNPIMVNLESIIQFKVVLN